MLEIDLMSHAGSMALFFYKAACMMLLHLLCHKLIGMCMISVVDIRYDTLAVFHD
jgi:hypothetical protein